MTNLRIVPPPPEHGQHKLKPEDAEEGLQGKMAHSHHAPGKNPCLALAWHKGPGEQQKFAAD